MSRMLLHFHSEDISALARSLKGQLTNCEPKPSHLELLNMLVRANGYRNFQHYRAQITAQNQLEKLPITPEPDSFDRIKRLLRFFDSGGRLMRWPSKRSQQEICLWVIWSRLPARQVLTEKEVDQLLKDNHLFGDHTLLRRWLCDYGMMNRTADCREYRRVEKRPPTEALELIRRIESARF
ncbi:DUF2087 domain-containing protein [Desulforegula conservatrix]|uniref:DUF2087 domain-containing protein n=1 Tax=Desulforegula conservatrix TaxID=153026 RepID=UPI000418916D|nr:DUF2087 domain-containing protein [Desulforegula conservatrix]